MILIRWYPTAQKREKDARRNKWHFAGCWGGGPLIVLVRGEEQRWIFRCSVIWEIDTSWIHLFSLVSFNFFPITCDVPNLTYPELPSSWAAFLLTGQLPGASPSIWKSAINYIALNSRTGLVTERRKSSVYIKVQYNQHALSLPMTSPKFQVLSSLLFKRLGPRHLGGSVGSASDLWFQLRSWSLGSWDRAPRLALCWQCRVCLEFSFSLFLCPTHVLSLSLSLSLKINKYSKKMSGTQGGGGPRSGNVAMLFMPRARTFQWGLHLFPGCVWTLLELGLKKSDERKDRQPLIVSEVSIPSLYFSDYANICN